LFWRAGFSSVVLSEGGANSLTVSAGDFNGLPPGTTLTVDGGDLGNTIDASALTATDPVIFRGGRGHDVFEFSAAGLTNADIVRGGAGKDELLMTTAGEIDAGGVSGVQLFILAGGAANMLVLTDANFTDAGKTITIDDGNAGNRISAAALAADNHIVVHAGTGADSLIGGAGNDVFYAGGRTKMTGGNGANEFIFSAAGRNTVTDFHASFGDELVFSNSGFKLGLKGATMIPQQLPSYLFVANRAGTFTTSAQRFAYDTTDGRLFYDAHGSASGSSRELVVTLGGDPHLVAGDLYFIR
jgi:Ca2+-binding RTX toxin-like protein